MYRPPSIRTFAGDQPARRLETALHVRRADRVRPVVARGSIDLNGTAHDEVDIDIEPIEERRDDVQARVGFGCLDRADHLT